MVLASRPDRTGDDVNACTCRTIVFAASPKIVMMDSAGCGLEQETLWSQEWTSWTSVWITEGERESIKELANAEKLEVAEIKSTGIGDRPRRVAGQCGDRNAGRS